MSQCPYSLKWAAWWLELFMCSSTLPPPLRGLPAGCDSWPAFCSQLHTILLCLTCQHFVLDSREIQFLVYFKSCHCLYISIFHVHYFILFNAWLHLILPINQFCMFVWPFLLFYSDSFHVPFSLLQWEEYYCEIKCQQVLLLPSAIYQKVKFWWLWVTTHEMLSSCMCMYRLEMSASSRDQNVKYSHF